MQRLCGVILPHSLKAVPANTGLGERCKRREILRFAQDDRVIQTRAFKNRAGAADSSASGRQC